jgi:hypothetical protein
MITANQKTGGELDIRKVHHFPFGGSHDHAGSMSRQQAINLIKADQTVVS